MTCPGDNDRFEKNVCNICEELDLINFSKDLQCVCAYPSQKKFGREARQENVKGCFVSSPEVKDMQIVILDDVYTTGATINECVSMLYDAGATKVTAIALGINQLEDMWRVPQLQKCSMPNCDGNLDFRFVTGDRNVFLDVRTSEAKLSRQFELYRWIARHQPRKEGSL